MTELIFFDIDGTLSIPEYRDDGRPVLGFHTVEGWINYCNSYGDEAYQFCRPLIPVKEYAKQKQAKGARLMILSVALCESEIRAKEVFLMKHYPGMFEEIVIVKSANEKATKIREIADRENVPLEHCELVEDTFMTLLDVMGDGVKVKHISEIVGTNQ